MVNFIDVLKLGYSDEIHKFFKENLMMFYNIFFYAVIICCYNYLININLCQIFSMLSEFIQARWSRSTFTSYHLVRVSPLVVVSESTIWSRVPS